MVLSTWFPVGQHYKVAMSAHCHKSEPAPLLPKKKTPKKLPTSHTKNHTIWALVFSVSIYFSFTGETLFSTAIKGGNNPTFCVVVITWSAHPVLLAIIVEYSFLDCFLLFYAIEPVEVVKCVECLPSVFGRSGNPKVVGSSLQPTGSKPSRVKPKTLTFILVTS